MGRQQARVLNRLLGKTVCLQGKFDYGVKERLGAMAEAQQGLIAEALDKSVDYLVIASLSGGKTVQKQALSLNAKGASIQVIDADGFEKLVTPTNEEVLAMIRGGGGKPAAEVLAKVKGNRQTYYYHAQQKPDFSFTDESFDGLDLSGFDLSGEEFVRCSFIGATLNDAHFGPARECNYNKAHGASIHFNDVSGCRFIGAKLKGVRFDTGLADVDFTSAALESAEFTSYYFHMGGKKQPAANGAVFRQSVLRSAKFESMQIKAPDFDEADLAGALFHDCTLEGGTFRKAILENATLIGCKLPKADFTGADLRRANLAGADLTDACFDGADLARCNLRGAALAGADLSKAKNYDPNALPAGAAGPALGELNKLAKKARRIEIAFRVRNGTEGEGEEVGIDTNSLQYGWGLRVPQAMSGNYHGRRGPKTISDAMLELANMLGNWHVRYETLEVSSTKSPTAGKELRELVMKGIAEAFAQPIPADEELAAATKTYRDAVREQTAADRERREMAKAEAEKQKAAEKKQIAKKVAKAVGKVTDIATFLKALEVRADKPKIQKATSMLKAAGFQLFNDLTDESLAGVVKSQTDPDLVYACRIDHEGQYACCTQNLNICGGLRGSICKHLLVLIIGLVKAGELDPTTIDGWIAKTHSGKPELDKEAMGAIFIKYKGAEAGEVDWRPTETLPEDYYSL